METTVILPSTVTLHMLLLAICIYKVLSWKHNGALPLVMFVELQNIL